MMKIVTIEREYGCGGSEIAQLLATRLAWKLWDQLLTGEIARLANWFLILMRSSGSLPALRASQKFAGLEPGYDFH